MRSAKFFLLALFCGTALLSCKKDDDENQTPSPQPEIYDNYSALRVGNYWIYELFQIDTLGNVQSLNKIDSCYIATDTLVKGKTYYKLVKPNPYPGNVIQLYPDYYLFRDSLHYIVDHKGAIHFSSKDNNTIFDHRYYFGYQDDTVASVITKMSPERTMVNVPAGIFNTQNVERVYKLSPKYSPQRRYGYEYLRYAENVGLVTETLISYLGEMRVGMSRERRLIRYHVQP